MNSNIELDEQKVDNIKYRLLDLETYNIVRKESNAAMISKIQTIIISEVDKRDYKKN